MAPSVGPSGTDPPLTAQPTKSPSDVVDVVVVDDPETAVKSRLNAEGACYAMTIHDYLVDRGEEWDRQIREAGLTEGWLVEDGLWVGEDLIEVVSAFGGTWGAVSTEPPARGLREMWIETERNGRPMAQQLIPWRTPKGRTVWHRWNTVTNVPCASSSP